MSREYKKNIMIPYVCIGIIAISIASFCFFHYYSIQIVRKESFYTNTNKETDNTPDKTDEGSSDLNKNTDKSETNQNFTGNSSDKETEGSSKNQDTATNKDVSSFEMDNPDTTDQSSTYENTTSSNFDDRK